MSAPFAKNGRIVSAEPIALYLDSNAFITAIETRGADETAVARLFAGAEARRLRRVTSELTLAEVLTGPARRRDHRLERAYTSLILDTALVEVHSVSRSILIETAQYRASLAQTTPAGADRRNFLPDAVHVVTAMVTGCTIFVTNDKRIRLPPGMRRIEPTADGIGAFLESP